MTWNNANTLNFLHASTRCVSGLLFGPAADREEQKQQKSKENKLFAGDLTRTSGSTARCDSVTLALPLVFFSTAWRLPANPD